ncbi:tyrosinase family oxidase copper chaperone [Streptomyces sp. NRRL S-1022]|uniref:tyrosinase family oxidase copper chaperone n=1 Tax=Streptomyces sp. NRRL S-1022 TaxID=1463880 RepID=UPI0004C17F6F|nr:tyrosinase family oxidase copper chaperone [Streptomyces sp. NRRL S-1022]
MVVGVGGAEVGTERQARAKGAGPSRREMARAVLSSATALALAPLVAASRPAPPAEDPGGSSFGETYRGRRIRGVLVPPAGHADAGGEWQITIDGRPLHLMRRADGTWLSMVDHYTSYRTPLEATRAAVDEIGPGRRLRDLAPHPFGRHFGAGTGEQPNQGGRHGVRA